MIVNDVKFAMDDVQQKASWQDIIDLYKLDEGDFDTLMCYKLTDSHIYKEKLKKMKVKHAAQVFSHRVSSTMQWTAKHGFGRLGTSSLDTANFISFMDQVFDSINGSTYKANHGKILRCAVKKNSSHMQFWEKAIKVFQSMKFITARGETAPPSVNNWIKTLRGFRYIWRKLCGRFKYLCPRNINQDPIENFFGCIRSHGVRNINPTCYSFIGSYKTPIINNFSSSHSPCANCENYDGSILNSLQSLLSVDGDNDNERENQATSAAVDNTEFENVENTTVIATHSYIAGYIEKI
ncbi:hypothetical protein NQ315_008277 [Exocentrus adspersus]|uniref:Uncharacterized protein n=1 Tax=Exocentrus adspersus TaxID=1586481 RepID=A0AAV8VMH4_9CUCU|nr:hypothetical protein NQ315_008277 [Exocentrus adspersus]